MARNKVLIGVITGEYARRADFYDYYNLLIKPEDAAVILCHDRSPAKGRNLIVEAAKDNNCTHVLFIDDDMAYKPDALLKLLEHDEDIISGLYLSRAYPHQPIIFDLADEDGSCFPMYLMGDEPRLKRIEAAGFGFLLIKMNVFDKLEKPYVRLGELNSEEWCDDIGFFKRVREAGIKSYCDMDVMIGHMGTMIIWPNRDASGKWMTGYDTNGTGILNTPQINPNVAYAFKKE
jgi:glycosyltransferase involved in cell wall biosynthesis